MSSKTSELKIIISGDGKLLDASLRQSDKQIDAWANHAKQKVDQANTGIAASFKRLGGKIDAKVMGLAANPLAMIGGVAGILMASRNIIELDHTLTTLRLNAGKTAEEQMILRKEILATAMTVGQSSRDMSLAMSLIVDKTGDFDFADKSIGGLGKVSTAMAADLQDVARLAASLKNNMNMSGDEVYKAMDIIATQGNIGSLVFEKLVRQSERLFAAGKAVGLKKTQFSEFGGFIQGIAGVFGTEEELSTSVMNIATRLRTERPKIESAIGISLFDKEGNLKSFKDTIEALVKYSGGDLALLNDIFGESSKAFIPLLAEYKEFGEMKSFNRFITDGEKAGFVEKAFTERTKEAQFQMKSLAEATSQFADAALSPGIATLSSRLQGLTANKEKLESIMTVFRGIGGLLAGVTAGVLKVLEGWGMLLQLYEAGAGKVADFTMGVAYDKKNAPVFDFLKNAPIVGPWVDIATRMPGLIGDLFNDPGAPVPRLLDPASAGTGASITTRSPSGGPAVVVPPITNKSDIYITIDKDGGVTSTASNADTKVHSGVDRGRFNPAK